MTDLHRYLTNPFANRDVSLNNLITFSTDHLTRMTSNNPGGIFADRITATTTALNGVESSCTGDETALALRKSRKQLKNSFRDSLPASIGKIYSAVTAKYGMAGAEVTECFPKGRGIFTSATDGGLAEELETLVNGLTAHQADLGAQVVADASGLLSSWQAVFKNSGDTTGGKSAAQADKAAAKDALALELFKNLLTLALNFPNQPEKLDTYMQGSLLEPHTHSTGTTPTPAPPSNAAGK